MSWLGKALNPFESNKNGNGKKIIKWIVEYTVRYPVAKKDTIIIETATDLNMCSSEARKIIESKIGTYQFSIDRIREY